MARRARAVAIAGSVAGILGATIAAWLGLQAWHGAHAPVARPAPRTAGEPAGAVIVQRALAASARAPGAASPAAVPASLEGTDADGAIAADPSGRLVIDRELRRLFDHFLAATGEEPIAMIRARIIAVLRQRLPATAVGEAIDILDRYLAYRDAARLLAVPGSAAAGLDQIHDLRARWLTPAVARAFFAEEEAAIYAALARRDAATDPALSPAERDRRLAELDAQMPSAERQARAAALAPLTELNRETAMRAAGASDAQIAAARTAAFGAEAADRLAELDHAHAAWDARLAELRAARAALDADPALDAAERARRRDELLAGFTAAERLRIDALDRLSAAHAPGAAR